MNLDSFFKKIFQQKEKFERQHPRVESQNIVKIFEESGNKVVDFANLRDLSMGGLRFRSTKSFDVEKLLKIVINLAEKSEQISVTAKVAWCRKLQKEDAYHIGVSFIDLNEKAEVLIKELAEQLVEK